MKKIMLMLVAIILLSCCCKHEQKMVEQAAYNYSYAMANYQVDEAEKYATDETKNTTLAMAKGIVQKVDPNYIKSDTPATIDIIDVKFVNDTCAVATYHKITPQKDFSDTLQLRKRDGKWLAHVIPHIYQMPEKEADTVNGTEIKTFQEPKKKSNM